MRLGKVVFHREYLVDLDYEPMVQHAKDALIEDIAGANEKELEWSLDYEKECDGDITVNDIEEFLTDTLYLCEECSSWFEPEYFDEPAVVLCDKCTAKGEGK